MEKIAFLLDMANEDAKQKLSAASRYIANSHDFPQPGVTAPSRSIEPVWSSRWIGYREGPDGRFRPVVGKATEGFHARVEDAGERKAWGAAQPTKEAARENVRDQLGAHLEANNICTGPKQFPPRYTTEQIAERKVFWSDVRNRAISIEVIGGWHR